jgi:formate-dependent nitrite reductase membrane component NrfD
MFKKRISDKAVKRWDIIQKVVIFTLIFAMVLGYASIVFAAGGNGMESSVKQAVQKALDIVMELGSVIIGAIGIINIIISMSTEDQHRRTSGLLMVAGAAALVGVKAIIDGMLGGGGGTSLLPFYKRFI